ncbi:MAG TPA: rhomboid family intramembrane serine protease [Acidimicrobiales bacterium]|nr:rhomboid family intramembrane serine protease [Acidimicrobiales bacterium]
MQSTTCYRHADRATGVSCTRCGRSICPECMIQAPVGHHCPTCVAEARGDTKKHRQVRWERPGAGAGSAVMPTVLVLIALNVLVFMVDRSDPTIQFRFADNPLLVARGDVYRLVTAAFLHANLLHLGLNMFGLYLFGPHLERALGWPRFLALYLVSALGAGICFFFFAALGTFSVGASGAVFGLFGAFFVILRARGGDTSQIVMLIVINLFIGASVPGIDNYAHIGGLLTGGAVALLYERMPVRPGRSQVAVHLAAVVVLVAMLATLAGARSRQLRAREGVVGRPAPSYVVDAPSGALARPCSCQIADRTAISEAGPAYGVAGVVMGSQSGRLSS